MRSRAQKLRARLRAIAREIDWHVPCNQYMHAAQVAGSLNLPHPSPLLDDASFTVRNAYLAPLQRVAIQGEAKSEKRAKK